MMQGPPHLPNRLPMPIHTFYHQPYSQSFQPSPPSTSPSTSPTTSPPRSLSHRYARLQQRQVNPQKVEAIDPRTQWSQFSQQPIYQDQSQSLASGATAVPRSTHAPRAFRRASLNERDEKQDEESVIVIRNGKQSSAAAPVRANVPAVSPPPPVVPASALPSTVHLSPQMQQQFLQQFYMQQLFLQQQQQQQQMQLQSQMPYPQLYNQMNMFAQQQQQQQQQQQSRPFSTPQVLPPPQFLYQPATSPTGPVGSWARKSGPTSTTTNTTRTIGLQQHSMTSTPVDCVPNRPQSTPIAPPSKVPLSNQFPLHSPPPPSTNTAHYPVPLAITYRVNSKPPSSSYIIPTRKNQPATAASTASNYSSNSSTNYHTRESSPSPSDTMDDPFPARPSHLDTSASSDGSEFDASDDDLEFVNEQSYSAAQNQQPNTNNDDDDEEFHRQNDSFIDGLVSSFSNKVGMARRPGLNVVVSLPQGSPQSSKASPPPPPAESRSRSRSTCRSNSRPTSRGTTASMQQRPASTNGLSQVQARREAALKFASSLSNVPRRSTATDSTRPSGSDSTTPTGASATIARPRTTIGGARSSREVVASSTRPTSRVGSADWTRSRSRPRSSNNMQQTMNAAAREAAAVFFQQNQNESGSPTSPAPGYNSFSKRHLSPPACTLSLQGSIFYNRLPDEMWIAIMQFLDVSTLLTTVSRLDTASKRLIADQEVWRNVSLASTLLSQPSSSNSSRLSSSMGELAFSTISSEIALQKLMNVSMRWTLLESLDLSGVGACIKDDFFLKLEQTVIPYWKLSLRNLSLARCAQITDVTLLLLADVCTQLDRLDLSWCQLCTDVGFDAIIRSCATTLTVAIFNRCHGLTDQTVETLASHATALLELDLTFCSNVTDHALEVLASDQSTCFYPARPVQSETALLTSVAPLYIGLQKLSLRWCRKITDAGIKFLMNGGVKPVAPIESLLPVGVPGENSAMIANPPAMIPTQVPIDPSAVRSNSLKTLILDHCSLLTDASFMHLSRSATQLTTLSAIYCKQLTPASLHYLIAGSVSQLTTLILDHCDVFHNYFCRKNAAVVTSVLSCPAFNHLTLLSWKTCAHAGRERSNHLEIEAECASHAAPVSKSHSRHNARTLICTSVSATAGNVLSWIKRK